MNGNHEVIFCIVNAGCSDAVMDIARDVGAKGGTVINARGTANPEAEKLFGITIQPEKEIVMIVVEEIFLANSFKISTDGNATIWVTSSASKRPLLSRPSAWPYAVAISITVKTPSM